jgi:hypothetical protein
VVVRQEPPKVNPIEKEEMMFNRTKGPDKPPFSHADDCKIVAADPSVKVEWSEIERGYWEAVCVSGKQYFYDRPADARVRLDQLDPKTSHHFGQCEFASESDPAIIRAVLKVTAKDGYAWVECGARDAGSRA